MGEVYVVESLRTPFGAFGGKLADQKAPQLAAAVMRRLRPGGGEAASMIFERIQRES
jgi:acetyl-CoA C-acetyltransferase